MVTVFEVKSKHATNKTENWIIVSCNDGKLSVSMEGNWWSKVDAELDDFSKGVQTQAGYSVDSIAFN